MTDVHIGDIIRFNKEQNYILILDINENFIKVRSYTFKTLSEYDALVTKKEFIKYNFNLYTESMQHE